MYKIILIGPPGAGKGTQANLLVKSLNLAQISTGDILRKSVCAKDILGVKANEYMQKGQLVPDDLVINIVADYLKKCSSKNGFLLDGFPRNINQAQALDNMNILISHIISIDVEDSVIVKRMTGRRVHVESGRVYHVDYNPPKVDGVDDITNQPLVQRKDDRAEIVKDRLKLYHDITKPLLNYYRENASKGVYKFISVDGAADIDQVHNKLKLTL